MEAGASQHRHTPNPSIRLCYLLLYIISFLSIIFTNVKKQRETTAWHMFKQGRLIHQKIDTKNFTQKMPVQSGTATDIAQNCHVILNIRSPVGTHDEADSRCFAYFWPADVTKEQQTCFLQASESLIWSSRAGLGHKVSN